MPKKESRLGRMEEIALQTAADMGFEFVALELAKEPQGLFLRFTIDKPDGITLDDCEAYHKAVQPYTDEVEFDFMEVSSPGADRPLRKQADFDRARGKLVEVKLYKPEHGKKLHTGELIGLNNGNVSILTDTGEELSFVEKSVALVKLVVEFDESDFEDETAVDDSDL